MLVLIRPLLVRQELWASEDYSLVFHSKAWKGHQYNHQTRTTDAVLYKTSCPEIVNKSTPESHMLVNSRGQAVHKRTSLYSIRVLLAGGHMHSDLRWRFRACTAAPIPPCINNAKEHFLLPWLAQPLFTRENVVYKEIQFPTPCPNFDDPRGLPKVYSSGSCMNLSIRLSTERGLRKRGKKRILVWWHWLCSSGRPAGPHGLCGPTDYKGKGTYWEINYWGT